MHSVLYDVLYLCRSTQLPCIYYNMRPTLPEAQQRPKQSILDLP